MTAVALFQKKKKLDTHALEQTLNSRHYKKPKQFAEGNVCYLL